MLENYVFAHKKTTPHPLHLLTNFPRTWPLEECSTTIKLFAPTAAS